MDSLRGIIIVKITGGLGNQMFQYAFARSIQNKHPKCKLILDTSDFKYDGLREYSLYHFALNKEVNIDESGKYNKMYDQRKNPLIKIGTKLYPRLQFNILRKFGIYIWDYARYIPVSVKYDKQIMLHGLWQSSAYFEDCIDIIRKEFCVIEEQSLNNARYSEQIRNTNSVCVHIRRGDFLSSNNKLAVCSNNYYIDAMNYLEERNDSLIYYIFSDDIEDVKMNFDFGKRNIIYVEENNPDYEELRLMSQCKQFIIANSTFSWWVSLLSECDNKTVIAPKTWYVDGRDVSHLMRKEWVIKDNE